MVIFRWYPGLYLVTPYETNGIANPLAKEVLTNANPGWMNNYSNYPITILAPVAGILGGIIVVLAASKAQSRFELPGFIFSGDRCDFDCRFCPVPIPDAI